MRALQRDQTLPLLLAFSLAGLATVMVPLLPGPLVDVSVAVAAAGAVLSLALAGGTRPAPVRHGWAMLAIWVSLAMISHLLWSLTALEPALGGMVTGIHLLMAPVALGGFAVLFRVLRAPGELLRRLLDGWLYAGTLLAVTVQFVVIPITGPGRLTQPGTITNFVYLAFDLTVLVILATFVLSKIGPSRPLGVASAVGAGAIAVSDALLLGADLRWTPDRDLASGLAAGAYVLAGFLPYLGGLPRPIQPYARRVSVTALAAPYTAALVGGGSLALSMIVGVTLRPLPVALFTSVVLALVVRQGLTLLDNVRLTSELAARENHFRSLVLGSSDVIMVTDGNGVIEYTSPAMARIFGYASDENAAVNLAHLLHPHDWASALTTIRHFLSSDAPHARIDARLRGADGEWRHTESTLSRDGQHRLIMNVRDVSDRVELRRELERLALHDTLTGLPNRVRLTDRLANALAEHASGRGDDDVGVIFLDLDGLKDINDASGHEAGDQVIVEVARRIVEVVRATDLVARFGGDEFVVVLDREASRETVLDVARAVIARIGSPIEIDGRQLTLTASAGVAFAADGADVPDVLRAADLAMYRAKVLGRGRIEVFHPELRVAAESRADLNSRLVRALEQQDFALQYQPVVELRSGRVVAVEALVRWRSESGILVTPKELIRLAEDSGQIADLGRWVVEESLAQAGRWRRRGLPVQLAVNLSATQVDDSRLVDVIATALRVQELPPQMLTLEITESVLLQRVDDAVTQLATLRSLGARVVLDDFGTGYSSLAYLSRLPVDGLKLDASFVRRLGHDKAATAVASAVVRLGCDLGLVITAEGVETSEQAEALLKMGCHRAQGYHYSGPLDAESVGRLFAVTLRPVGGSSSGKVGGSSPGKERRVDVSFPTVAPETRTGVSHGETRRSLA